MVSRQLAVAVVSAALVLPTVAACGGARHTSTGSPEGVASTGAAGAGESKKQQSIDMRRREENMIAACMKKSGFKYVPYVPQEMLNPPAPKPTDYASVKAFRSKYGFGNMYAPLVYPGDPNLAPPAKGDNPNDAIVSGLDKAQYKAYRTAFDGYFNDKSGPTKLVGGCVADAVKAVDPKAWKQSEFRDLRLRDKAGAQAEYEKSCAANPAACKRADDEQAQLTVLGEAYGACLKSKGYPVDLNADIVDEVARTSLTARFDELDTDPDVFTTTIDPTAARAELKNEIKVALEDLECGKDYLTTKAGQEARDAELSPPSGQLP
jgi:hypothetical protein